uniref:Aminotransferase-like plant mobile domain-containing protein n=1 Tax=Ananas comosus var. bracteatus TaxID=296719 RepID=A0A6V7NJT8_ANACO|nr:unnamed protein product [Ananas comosus var. bracteatus]
MAYNPDDMIDFEAHLDLADLAYTKFICRFASQSPTPVTKKEHTTFLLYWLCHNLFCTRSQKINRDFVPIVVGLANNKKLALGVYFLAFVYRENFDSIKSLSSREGLAIGSGCGILWFLQMCLQIYFPSRCRTSLDIDSTPHFDTYGLGLDCPKPISSGHPYEFGNYFKVCYESCPHHLISWSPFAECVTGPPWLLTRYETIPGKLATSRSSEYSDVWFFFTSCVRSAPIPVPAKFFTANTAVTVLPLRAQPKLIGFRLWGIVFDASSN